MSSNSSEITNVVPMAPSVPATAAAGIQQKGQSADAVTPAPANSLTSPPANEKTPDQLKSSVAAANSMLQAANRTIEFQVDESSKKVVVKIVDTETGALIMQMPSEHMLKFTQNLINQGGDIGSIIQQKA